MSASVTRLYISPLSSGSLATTLGTELSKLATNASYHSLQTFPDSGYGYVDLPAMEAERVRKRLNGSILKGKKVKVEEARPKKRKHNDDTLEDVQRDEQSSRLTAKKSKKSKHDRNTVPGHELSPERKVKRGWTEPKAETGHKRKKDKTISTGKPQSTSKYTEKEELLFRTKVPKNKSSQRNKDAKGKNVVDGTEVVHEFKKSTTMPSFLRSEISGNETAAAYEDGQGWIDGEGKIVEAEGLKVSKRRKAAKSGIEKEVIDTQPARTRRQTKLSSAIVSPDIDRSHDSSLSEESSSESSVEDDSSSAKSDSDEDETSSSGSSSSDNASEASDASTLSATREGSVPIVDITTPSKSALHPLEALFKKPVKPASLKLASSSHDAVKPSLEVQTSFSFFDQRDGDDELPAMPMTPFSSQDVRTRGTRSAAPTPDTAHPSRMNSIFNGEESEGELSEMDESADGTQPAVSQSLEIPQTDFEKQFWEKRGENNRSWKARRRAVLKEKRQRENRARRPKNW